MPPKLKNPQPLNPKPSNPQTHKLINSIFPDRTSVVIFLLAFTLLLTFWQVGLLLNDEWITANQLAHRRCNKIRH